MHDFYRSWIYSLTIFYELGRKSELILTTSAILQLVLCGNEPLNFPNVVLRWFTSRLPSISGFRSTRRLFHARVSTLSSALSWSVAGQRLYRACVHVFDILGCGNPIPTCVSRCRHAGIVSSRKERLREYIALVIHCTFRLIPKVCEVFDLPDPTSGFWRTPPDFGHYSWA